MLSSCRSQPEGSLGADVGCGNGKYLSVNPKIYTIGSDYSSSLIQICQEKGHEVMVADGLLLPFKSNYFVRKCTYLYLNLEFSFVGLCHFYCCNSSFLKSRKKNTSCSSKKKAFYLFFFMKQKSCIFTVNLK